MKNSKLIFLLKTFKKNEWRRFREFLASPYFNKRTDLMAFFQYIERTAPEFSEKKLEKEIVFKKLYPNQGYNDKQMRYLMNYTLRTLEHFLGYQKIESLDILNTYILEELVDRKIEKNSKKYFEKITMDLENVKKKSSSFFYKKYKLADISNEYFNKQDLREDGGSLQSASERLDNFYLFKKLKYSCEMINRQKLFLTEYNLELTNLFYNYLEEANYIKEPLIIIYLQIYAILIKEKAEKNFERLKKLIQIHSQEISITDKQHIYLYAINYCGRQIKYNYKINYYANECLKLYLEGIEQEFLFIDNFLSPWTFKNVVKLGFNLKKYDWTEQFIQDYYQKLAPEFQDDALHFNLADLAYRRQNYKDAQHHLLLVAYSDVFYTLGAKTMLLKIYYENNELESLFSLVASFSIYLRRNKKISNNFRETYLNFVTYLGQVLRSKKSKIPIIIERIHQTELLTNRSWLLQICEDRLKRRYH